MKVEEVLSELFDEELYDDVCILYEMNACSAKGMTKHAKLAIHRFGGDAYFHLAKYELSLAVNTPIYLKKERTSN